MIDCEVCEYSHLVSLFWKSHVHVILCLLMVIMTRDLGISLFSAYRREFCSDISLHL